MIRDPCMANMDFLVLLDAFNRQKATAMKINYLFERVHNKCNMFLNAALISFCCPMNYQVTRFQSGLIQNSYHVRHDSKVA